MVSDFVASGFTLNVLVVALAVTSISKCEKIGVDADLESVIVRTRLGVVHAAAIEDTFAGTGTAGVVNGDGDSAIAGVDDSPALFTAKTFTRY
jgi:hypothetical protein